MGNAVVVRSRVEPERDYRKHQEMLRFDFVYSCAYCTMTEVEALGIGFQIDHYLPKERHPELAAEYGNLMWSCQRCNRSKSNYSPDAEDEKEGRVVIKIDDCDPREHIEADGSLVKGKTTTGTFNIDLLDLNRKQLRRVRELRERLHKSAEFIAFGVHQLMSMSLDDFQQKHRVSFLKLKRYIQDREKEVNLPVKDLIREFAHSELLDADPEQGERRKKAKQYLKELKATV